MIIPGLVYVYHIFYPPSAVKKVYKIFLPSPKFKKCNSVLNCLIYIVS